ncbi:MAG: serine/threonine-protein kinase [Melioribacteraceae bacterium]
MQNFTSSILFERFEVIDLLKKDEHAAVFLANHIYLSKKIILKVLDTAKISDQSLVDRFKREAKLLAQLDNPNIIKVLDFGMDKEYFYISFEYFEGSNLRKVINDSTLDFEKKKQVMIQILQGLSYANNNGIIHRDIKPENIFVNSNLQAKIGDFGLALSAEESFVTQPYSIVGTPSYMSPEQIRGEKLTLRSDLFSVGVVFYELFTGKNPFLKDNLNLTINEIMSYNYDSVVEELNGLPDEIKNIVKKLLYKNPAERYGSAAEILSELGEDFDDQIVDAAKELMDTEIRPKRNNKKWVLAVFFIFIASLFSIYLFNSQSSVKNPINSDSLIAKNSNEIEPKTDPVNDLSTEAQNAKPIEDNKLVVDEKEPTNSKNNPNLNEPESENAKEVIRNGSFYVECFPWADIYINNEFKKTTPLREAISLPEGEYSIRLVHPDYPVYSGKININPNRTTNLKISLDTLFAYLNCRVYPWGDVYVNNVLKGTTPLKSLIRIMPGVSNKILIKNSSFKDIDTVIKVSRGDTVSLKISFK